MERFLEDIKFEKCSYEQDNKAKKHACTSKEAVYNPTPHFVRVSSQTRIEGLAKGKGRTGRESKLIRKMLQSNNCQQISCDEMNEALP